VEVTIASPGVNFVFLPNAFNDAKVIPKTVWGHPKEKQSAQEVRFTPVLPT